MPTGTTQGGAVGAMQGGAVGAVGGEEAFNPADYGDGSANPLTNGQAEQPKPTWGDYASATVQVAPTIARNIPQMVNPVGAISGMADSPKLTTGLALGGEAANVAGNALSKVAPRTGTMLSTVGKGLSPVRQLAGLAGKGSTLSRMAGVTAGAGGKMLPAFGGALNVGWAPIEALGHVATGNTEEAKKLFYDQEYNRSLGDSSKSYLSRVSDAADPRRFYNNVQNTASALGTAQGQVETVGGALDMAAGLIGQDQQTRYNKYINSDAGKAALAEKMTAKNKEINAHNAQQAINHRVGEMRDGQMQPTAEWLAEQKQRYPGWSPEDIERHFLNTVYRWSSTIPDENGNEVNLHPTHMRQLHAGQ